jgi:hypothetical protein
MSRILAITGALLLLAGCAHGGHHRDGDAACPLASQQPMVMAELFFGRDVAGRAPVSDAEWAEFSARDRRAIPRQVHRLRRRGHWRDDKTAAIVRERSRSCASPPCPAPILPASSPR